MAPVLAAQVRWWRCHPWLLAATVLGIALGVAAAAGIDTASVSSKRAFAAAVEGVAGRATHRVVGEDGVPASLVATLVRAGHRPAPVIEAEGVLNGRVLRLLAVDPLAESRVRPHLADAGRGERLERLMTEPGSCLLAADTAAELGLAPGATVPFRVGTRTLVLTLVGTIQPSEAGDRAAARDLVVADLATGAWLRGERLDRIDLVLEEAQAAAVAALLPPDLALEPGGARAAATQRLTAAFHSNLSALALVAMLTGFFLVLNAVGFAVLRRSEDLARLRLHGVTRGQLAAVLLAEALVLGVVGSVIGGALGILAAHHLVQGMARTINDLYIAVAVREVALDWSALLGNAGLGIAAAVLAALPPLVGALRRPPAAELRAGTGDGGRGALLLLALAPVIGGAAALIAAGSTTVGAGFLAIGLALIACACAAPGLLWLAATVAGRGAAGSSGGPVRLVLRMALGGVRTGIGRIGLAAAALVVAVAASLGVELMIRSFRATVEVWLAATLQADLYVTVPGTVSARVGSEPMPEALAERLAAVPGIAAAIQRRDVPHRDHAVSMVTSAGRDERAFPVADAPPDWWTRFRAGEALVTEPFAFRHGVRPGQAIAVLGRSATVAGIVRDYADERGQVYLAVESWQDRFPRRGVTALGLTLAPGADPAAVEAAVRAAAGDQAVAVVRSGDLRRTSMQVFDRTFAITGAIRLIAGAVAALGVLAAAAALVLERAAEARRLRAHGMTGFQVGSAMAGQGLILGLGAGLLAVPAGILVAWMLTTVVNQRSFGWGLELAISLGPCLAAVGLAVGAAVPAAVWAGWRLGRSDQPRRERRGDAGGPGDPSPGVGRLAPLAAVVLLAGCGAGTGKTEENPGLRGVLGEAAEGFERVTGPRPLVWPDDHGAHPRHRSEWWYWTGDLRAADGRRFGYQVTVFRFALSATAPPPGPWVSNQAWMAHAALSDGAGNRFRSVEHLQRGAMGLAGATAAPFAVWCADVRAEGVGGTPELPVVRLTAPRIEDAGYDLVLEPTRPVLLQGDAGYSRKGQDPTNASTYYSFTRLRTRGTVTVAGEAIPVEGWSWFDREWSTSALDPGTVGWDWLSLHLRDGSDLMLYRLRTADGGQSPWSKGVLRRADGSRRDLASGDIAMSDLGRWASPAGGSYPAGLRVRTGDLDLTIRPLIQDQEWRTSFRYWEGLVDALGPDGAPLGSGYLEMTGH